MKTKEQKQQEAIAFLEKTAMHVFKSDNGEFYAVRGNEGKWFTIRLNQTTGEKIVKPFDPTYWLTTNDPRGHIQSNIFPKYKTSHFPGGKILAVRQGKWSESIFEIPK